MEKQQNPTPIVGASVIQQHSNSTSPVDHYQSSDDVNISTEVFISSPSSYNGSPPPVEGIAVQPSNSFVSPTSSSYNGGNGNLTNGITIPRSNSFVSPTSSSYNGGNLGGNLKGGIDEDISDKEFFDSLSPGYRFCPTDTDLIVHYLQKKINNDRLPRNQIRHVNIYQHSPEHISELYPPVGDKEWYFFTPRDRKYRNGNRPNRAAGCGYWKATGADRSIKNKNVKVGFRKALVYYQGKPPKGSKTNWIMHEYRVDGSPRPKTSLTDMRLDDFVLCRIYKKTDKTFKNRPHKEDFEVANENGEANGIVDPHAHPSDAEKKCDLDIDREFKELEAGYMHSQFHNGGFRDMPVGMEASSTANHAKYFNGNFHFPPNYAAKPMSFRQSMYAQESAFMPKYLNSLDHKPRGIDENLFGIKDYENYTVASDIIIPDFEFAIPIENDTPGFDNFFINYSSCNSFETSNNSPDTPKRVDPILSQTQKSSSS